MDRAAFDRAAQEAATASAKLDAIRRAHDLVELNALWSEYLTHTQRAFTRLRIACSKGASKGWADRVINTRHNDDLLKYILHARNADEHGIAPITETSNGAIAFKPKPGFNAVEIDYLHMSGGRTVIGPRAAATGIIELIPGEVRLVPVRDRGQQYDLPKSHLGQVFENVTLVSVGEVGLAFLQSAIQEASATFL